MTNTSGYTADDEGAALAAAVTALPPVVVLGLWAISPEGNKRR
jgi:hypothetical protein